MLVRNLIKVSDGGARELGSKREVRRASRRCCVKRSSSRDRRNSSRGYQVTCSGCINLYRKSREMEKRKDNTKMTRSVKVVVDETFLQKRKRS